MNYEQIIREILNRNNVRTISELLRLPDNDYTELLTTLGNYYIRQEGCNYYTEMEIDASLFERRRNSYIAMVNSENKKKKILLSLKEIMHNKDRLQMFLVIFHELRHIIQDEKILSNPNHFASEFIRMEQIICDYNYDYYLDNWDTMYIERDAEFYSYIYFIKFLQEFGIGVSKEWKLYLEDSYKREQQKRLQIETEYSENHKKAYEKCVKENNVDLDTYFGDVSINQKV